MAATKYTYSISEDTPNDKVASDRLTQEIRDSDIVTALDYINTDGDELDIWMKDELSSGDETILDGIVSTHSGEPLPENVAQDVNIKTSDVDLPTQAKGFRDLTGHNVLCKGFQVAVTKNDTTLHEACYASNMYMQGMNFKVDDNATWDDYIEIELVDVDGVYYPEGTVLAQFGVTICIWPSREFTRICDDAKLVPAGIYIRTRYVCAGTENDVRLRLEHCMRT